MRTAGEIYAAYTIMPALQLHQLRVAAVGKMIADHFSGTLHSNDVILACLFHDTGNIIKFDLDNDVLSQLREPEGKEYWQRVKDEWIAKYGNDEHVASLAIAHARSDSRKTSARSLTRPDFLGSKQHGTAHRSNKRSLNMATCGRVRSGFFLLRNGSKKVAFAMRRKRLQHTRRPRAVSRIHRSGDRDRKADLRAMLDEAGGHQRRVGRAAYRRASKLSG